MAKESTPPKFKTEKARSVMLDSESWVPNGVVVRIVFELLAAMAGVFDWSWQSRTQQVIGLLMWMVVLKGLVWGFQAAIGQGEACDICRTFGFGH